MLRYMWEIACKVISDNTTMLIVGGCCLAVIGLAIFNGYNIGITDNGIFFIAP